MDEKIKQSNLDEELTKELVQKIKSHFNEEKRLTQINKARIASILTATLALTAGLDQVHRPTLNALEAASSSDKKRFH